MTATARNVHEDEALFWLCLDVPVLNCWWDGMRQCNADVGYSTMTVA